MKIVAYILAVIITLTGCIMKNEKSVEKQINYFFVKHNIESCNELTLDTVNVDFTQDIKDSIFTLNYIYHTNSVIDSVTYKLKESNSYKPVLLVNNINLDFIFVAKENFQIKGIDFMVYKYAKNPFAIDGCITHFWTPKIGILTTRSATWVNYSKLLTSNDSINEYIDLLTEMIFQKVEFYKGCSEELELIPKKDIQEFYNWKNKGIEKLIIE
ncbi:MAG: hypothetical protein CVU05_03455 [Bacteroidetes bacterium HGW-Bacteroidetes-21]|nr:MAG: hypothetical protein CVU05_03455 [Bacteroidetes bacterium HGW-Bacteroidetes-21]